jgi:hypothetical protein
VRLLAGAGAAFFFHSRGAFTVASVVNKVRGFSPIGSGSGSGASLKASFASGSSTSYSGTASTSSGSLAAQGWAVHSCSSCTAGWQRQSGQRWQSCTADVMLARLDAVTLTQGHTLAAHVHKQQ